MLRKSMLAAWLVVLVNSVDADAQPARDTARGELLYSTHCISCHTTQVHWREKKIATDWSTQQAQVRRWQDNTGLAWSNEDIAQAARYLNAIYYRYPAAD